MKPAILGTLRDRADDMRATDTVAIAGRDLWDLLGYVADLEGDEVGVGMSDKCVLVAAA